MQMGTSGRGRIGDYPHDARPVGPPAAVLEEAAVKVLRGPVRPAGSRWNCQNVGVSITRAAKPPRSPGHDWGMALLARRLRKRQHLPTK